MHRGKSFLLVETPDVKLVDGVYAGDLLCIRYHGQSLITLGIYLFQIVLYITEVDSVRHAFQEDQSRFAHFQYVSSCSV